MLIPPASTPIATLPSVVTKNGVTSGFSLSSTIKAGPVPVWVILTISVGLFPVNTAPPTTSKGAEAFVVPIPTLPVTSSTV